MKLLNRRNLAIVTVLIACLVVFVGYRYEELTVGNLYVNSIQQNTGQALDLSSAVFSGASPFVFEGATSDAYETTLAITDPTADRTVSLPNATGTLLLSTAAEDASNSINGVNNGFEFEGATQDAYETTITVTDPTADRAISFPNAGGTVLLSTAADDASNSITGVNNGFQFEGATQDAYETTVSITDPTADRTVSVPDATGTLLLSTAAVDASNSITGVANGFQFEGATQDAYETTISITDPTADRTVTVQNQTGTIELVERKLNETVTTANVITAAECGTTFFLNAQAGFQSTLPAVSTIDGGCEFKFIVVTAPSDGNYTIISGNSLENVITGGVVERETDDTEDGPYQADGDTITFVATTAVVGDYVEFISDGSKYYMHGQVNADGGLTAAQAD